MFDALFNIIESPQSMLAIATAIAVFATVVMLSNPIVARHHFKSRLKSVASERERIRARERARLTQNGGHSQKNNPLQKQQAIMQRIVKKFNLRDALDDGSLNPKLAMAGFRGPFPSIVFLFARFVLPFIFFIVAILYIFITGVMDAQPLLMKLVVALSVAYLGFMAPNIYLKNKISKRQASIQKAFPDALDMLLICVESGMSVEAAFHRVSKEVGQDSQELAEELALTNAELSFLEKRTKAYENLAARTGLDGVKACTVALIQAEKYGTPVGSALRVMAQENRDMRMTKAEQKAASLPPKLTVPMIVFFLPVLFLIIAGPVIIRLVEQGLL